MTKAEALNSLTGKGEDPFTGHIHLLTYIWQSASRLSTDKQHSSQDGRLIFGKARRPPRVLLSPYTALRRAKVGLELEKVYFQSGQLPTCLIQNPGTRASPTPMPEAKAPYLLYIFPTQRWPARILPRLLRAIQEFAQPCYYAASNLTPGNPATTNSKSQEDHMYWREHFGLLGHITKYRKNSTFFTIHKW